ncbi:MAG TPA: pitrilysin family protein [bacterium]|nr:pitrilysin family protein [bacterium]
MAIRSRHPGKHWKGILTTLIGLAVALAFAAGAEAVERRVRSERAVNGLDLVMEEVPGTELVNLSLLVKTGSATEGDYAGTGITHLLEHLIFKPGEQTGLAETVERTGGYTNAFTSLDSTVFTATVPAGAWQEVLPVLLDAVFKPAFNESDFEKEREVVLRELSRNGDNPAQAASRGLWETAFLAHPYRNPVGGRPERLKGLSFKDLTTYHRRTYQPGNAILAVTGKIAFSESPDLLRLASSYPDLNLPTVSLPAEPDQAAGRETRRSFPTGLAYLYLGYHIPGFTHPDAPSLDILAMILGEGETSRLYRALVKTGLAYSTGAYAYTPRDPGLFIITAVCQPDNLDAVQAAIRREAAGLVRLSEAEIKRARTRLETRSIFGLESLEGRSQDLASSLHLTGSPLFLDAYLAGLARIDRRRLARAAADYLKEENSTRSILVPEEKTGIDTPPADPSRPGTVRVFRLENGTVLLAKRNNNLPLVSISLLMKGGRLFETEKSGGSFDLLAEMLKAGTRKLDARAVADRVADWGGSLNPYAGNNSFGLTLEAPSRYWREGLSLMSELLIRPGFPDQELDRLREESIGAVTARDENDPARALNALKKSAFGEHPYGLPGGGSITSLKAIDRTGLLELYRNFVRSDNLVITVLGDIDPDEIAREAGRRFRSLPSGSRLAPPPLPEAAPGGRLELETRKRESVVMIGFPGLAVDSPERGCLELLAEILNGQEGLLFQRLREREPLVYSSSFSYFLGLQPGLLFFQAQCRPERVGRVTEILNGIIEELRTRDFPGDQLAAARRRVVGTRLIGRQTLSSQALDYGLNQLYGLDWDYSARLESGLPGIGTGELAGFCRRFLDPNRAIVVTTVPSKTE